MAEQVEYAGIIIANREHILIGAIGKTYCGMKVIDSDIIVPVALSSNNLCIYCKENKIQHLGVESK